MLTTYTCTMLFENSISTQDISSKLPKMQLHAIGNTRLTLTSCNGHVYNTLNATVNININLSLKYCFICVNNTSYSQGYNSPITLTLIFVPTKIIQQLYQQGKVDMHMMIIIYFGRSMKHAPVAFTCVRS